MCEIDWPSPARLDQSAERKALNLVVVGSSPTVGDAHISNVVSLCPGSIGKLQKPLRTNV